MQTYPKISNCGKFITKNIEKAVHVSDKESSKTM